MPLQTNRVTVEIETDASGDYSTETIPMNGRLMQFRYVPDGSTPLATGADLTIVGRDTGLVIANLTNIGVSAFTMAPRQLTHDSTGTPSSTAEGEIIVDEALDVTVAQGGANTLGTLYIWTIH